jgi:mannosyltransferase OCH1-like enzyme
MIPKTIWQTYETTSEELNSKAKDGIETWKNLNPGWSHGYMSGQDREDFFKTEFGGEVFDTYMKLPLGVMKAGLWRFGILYINGGVYADLDTECISPIDSWLDPQYDMVVDIERDTPWYATQVIAASKGHKFLEDALNMAVERARDGIVEQQHMVHYYTDVAMFTDSLFKSMNITDGYKGKLIKRTLQFNELPIAKEQKFFSFGGADA